MDITIEDLDKILFRVKEMRTDKWYSLTEEQSEIIRKYWELIHDYIDGYVLSMNEDYTRVIKRKY